jgi:cysteinyl-tRNA synthetase
VPGARVLAGELRALADVAGVLQVAPDQWFRLSAERPLEIREGGEDAPTLSEAQIEQLIRARETARRSRDFALADKVRAQLSAAGVVLEDQPGGGTTWKRA